MKSQTSFVCQECGYESPQWLGKCPECGEWNTLREIVNLSSKGRSARGGRSQISKSKVRGSREVKPKTLGEIVYQEKSRLSTGFSEMDGVLGGGIVRGSVILLAGDPGIGKSTLLLQACINLAKSNKILYISAEESEEQVKLRAKRIFKNSDNLDFLILSETDVDLAIEVIGREEPSLVVIDSIQAMESENLSGLSGSVGQVRYSASQFIRTAKTLNIPVIIVGHVTKEGMVAGPMILSHMVDAVLFLEGEKTTPTRILRSLKNRFGPVDEVGIFSMEEKGMVEIKDSSQVFLSKDTENSPGSILVATLEGTRTFLVEIQALVVFSKLPMPRRVASGIDYKRLELLLAVLQKHCRLPLDTMDVFVNVAGGLRLSDPAADLGICLAIFSSFKNLPLQKTVAISEIGLLGELRSIPFLEKRVKQAQRLGFKKIISSSTHKRLLDVLRSLSK
ncbi:MAG: DNA repair protein RadA [Patescibacteria group bacterium]|nr:DNA repair protein RadA [Patescibacteria group bacterium]